MIVLYMLETILGMEAWGAVESGIRAVDEIKNQME